MDKEVINRIVEHLLAESQSVAINEHIDPEMVIVAHEIVLSNMLACMMAATEDLPKDYLQHNLDLISNNALEGYQRIRCNPLFELDTSKSLLN